MPRNLKPNNFIVRGERADNGYDTEIAAIKAASRRVTEQRGQEATLVYKLHKIVRAKIAPVEIKDVSI